MSPSVISSDHRAYAISKIMTRVHIFASTTDNNTNHVSLRFFSWNNPAAFYTYTWASATFSTAAEYIIYNLKDTSHRFAIHDSIAKTMDDLE